MFLVRGKTNMLACIVRRGKENGGGVHEKREKKPNRKGEKRKNRPRKPS